MRRPQLEHVIRAAAGITGATEIVVIGSQAVLGQFPDAPADLLVSIEADVFTFRNPPTPTSSKVPSAKGRHFIRHLAITLTAWPRKPLSCPKVGRSAWSQCAT
jgi:hypothetical protein